MRIELLLDWLREDSPDIVLLQETKCENRNFPTEMIEDLGYNVALNGQKTHNGVAILSKFPLEDIKYRFEEELDPEQARYIEALVNINGKVATIASVYVPNGGGGEHKFSYKLAFLDALYEYKKSLLAHEEIIIFGGDYNVALEEIDVYDPISLAEKVCFSNIEQSKLRAFQGLGYYDAFRLLYPDKKEFSWWDYRAGGWQKNHGMRIDYLFLSPAAADLLQEVVIEKNWRAKAKPSDHVPIVGYLAI